MRKKFIFYVLLPLLAALLVVYFFIDRWVEAGLETAGERITGARVDIDDLRLTLSPLAVQFARMQVADPQDPWTNLFETSTVRFAMNSGQLLRGKYIIETMEVNDLIIGTKRTTDGSLPGVTRTPGKSGNGTSFTELARSALEKGIEKTPIFDPAILRRGINIDSLIKAVDLRSLAHIETLKTQASAAARQWDGALQDMETGKKRLAAIDSSVRTINPSALKDVGSIMAALTTIGAARQGITDVVSTVETRAALVTTDVQRLSASVRAIDTIAADDYHKILALARLPDVNAMGIAEVLLGKKLFADVTKYLHYVDLVREHIPASDATPEVQTPPRLKGVDIHFPVDRGYPKFWIRSIVISGGTDQRRNPDFLYAKGHVTDVSNDQHITHLPMKVELTASRGHEVTAEVGALIDRTGALPVDEYKVGISGVPLAAFEAGRPDFLPATISGTKLGANVTVTIPGQQFDARAGLDFRTFSIAYAAPPAHIGERLAREVLAGVQGFTVALRLWNTSGPFKTALTTDLDDQFAARVKAVLGAELSKIQTELRTKVYALIAAKRREFESVYNAKRDEAERRLAGYQSMVQEKIALVEAKKQELSSRLEKEKTSRVDDALKKLLKK